MAGGCGGGPRHRTESTAVQARVKPCRADQIQARGRYQQAIGGSARDRWGSYPSHAVRGDARFVLGKTAADGVGLRIETEQPLGDIVRRVLRAGQREYDRERLGPADYLKRFGARVWVSALPTGEIAGDGPPVWRYVEFAAVPVTRTDRLDANTLIADLSADSEDRDLVARLAETGVLRTSWPRNGIELDVELCDDTRAVIRDALANTAGVKSDAWREEAGRFREQRNRLGFVPFGPARQRVMQPPARPLAWFAARSGIVPPNGTPTIAGITLPTGSRRGWVVPAYWISDAPLADPAAVAGRLAAAFADTGLWPVLWAEPTWEPEEYMGGHGNIDPVELVDPEQIFRQGWPHETQPEVILRELEPLGTEFPGLAQASDPPPPHDPFAVYEQALAARAPFDAYARLMLVPCNRPADVPLLLGFQESRIGWAQYGAVLRSWEERFAAVPIVITLTDISLSVAAPPTTPAQVLRVAAEHLAVMSWYTGEAEGALRRRMRSLVSGTGSEYDDYVTPRCWARTDFGEP